MRIKIELEYSMSIEADQKTLKCDALMSRIESALKEHALIPDKTSVFVENVHWDLVGFRE